MGDLVRILVVGTAGYVALVAVLRISGKRTLSKLNAFDFVVTVALGSVLASMLLSSSVSLTEGVTALALLAALQYAVAYSASRSRTVRTIVKSEPRLLVRDGRILPGAVRAERLSESEILQALRAAGHPRLEDVAAVVLETDGTLSVLGEDGGAVRAER